MLQTIYMVVVGINDPYSLIWLYMQMPSSPKRDVQAEKNEKIWVF